MAAHDSRWGSFFYNRGDFFGQTFLTHLQRKLRVASRCGEGREKKGRNTLASALPCGISIYSEINSNIMLTLESAILTSTGVSGMT